jgi:hypothetical protein
LVTGGLSPPFHIAAAAIERRLFLHVAGQQLLELIRRAGLVQSFYDTEHLGMSGAVGNVVGIRCGAISGNMKISFQAARSIG